MPTFPNLDSPRFKVHCDRIDKYLSGAMTPEEKSTFLYDCKHDVDLAFCAYTIGTMIKSLSK